MQIDITLCGVKWIADPSGALYWPDESLLVVSDLHLEKGSYFAERGICLPPYDSRTTLGRLRHLTARYKPQTVIALGDSFHDPDAPSRLDPEDRAAILSLTGRTDWIWINGNHDPEPPGDLGGRGRDELTMGLFTFRHEPTGAEGEIAGHLHPCASVATRARRIRRRCFVSDGACLVMPAFGAYTGGLDVLAPAFDAVFTEDFHTWLLGDARVYPVARAKLLKSAEGQPPGWRL